jgi:hypothetical protein
VLHVAGPVHPALNTGSSQSVSGTEQGVHANGVSEGPSAQPPEVTAAGSDSADLIAADEAHRPSATTASATGGAHASGATPSADAGICVAADAAQARAAQQGSAAGSSICPLCLGILQVPDSPQALPTGTAKIALPDMDASGGEWRLVPTGAVTAIAAAARQALGRNEPVRLKNLATLAAHITDVGYLGLHLSLMTRMQCLHQ